MGLRTPRRNGDQARLESLAICLFFYTKETGLKASGDPAPPLYVFPCGPECNAAETIPRELFRMRGGDMDVEDRIQIREWFRGRHLRVCPPRGRPRCRFPQGSCCILPRRMRWLCVEIENGKIIKDA